MLNIRVRARPVLPYLIPAERLLLLGLLAAAIFLAAGYPLLLPDSEGGQVLEMISNATHYGVILTICMGVYVLMAVARRLTRQVALERRFFADLACFLRLLMSFVAAIYLMLLFKWWAHLGLANYDPLFLRLDALLLPVKSALFAFAQWAALPPVYYFNVFSLIFIAAYMLAVALDVALFERMVTAGIAVALLGGLCYMLFPAYGPFIALPATGDILSQTQTVMRGATEAFRASHGAQFDRMKFEAALGAMPSLHVAHTVVVARYMQRLSRTIGAVFWLLALYITAYAVVTGFHYLVDLPAGLLVAWASLRVSEGLFRPDMLKK